MAFAPRLVLRLLVLAVALAGFASAAHARPRDCAAMLSELTVRLRADLHSGQNYALEDGGRDIREYVSSIPHRCGRYAVPPLVRELRDPDDAVRLFAALCLGELGRVARAAAPALEAALKLDKCWCLGPGDCMKPSWSSTGAIRVAMIEITGSEGDPSIYGCDYSGGEPFHPGP